MLVAGYLGAIAARTAVAGEPVIIGTQTFVDSTSGKTTDYSFSATVPADCTLVVLLYGIGPVSQAATGLTNVRLGSSTMAEHPDLAPNAWAAFRPGVGGYYLLNPPTGSQTLLATPEAATHAVSIQLIYLKGFAADPIGAGDNFDGNTNVTACSSSLTTEGDNSYILDMIAVRNNPFGLALSNGFTGLIPPGNSDGTTFDDHTYIVGYKHVGSAQAYTYGGTWNSPSTRAGCGAIEIKVGGSEPPPPPPSSLPEDEPLPAADVTVTNITPATFADAYNAASLATNTCTHLVLNNGNYGSVTLNANKAGATAYGQGKPIVIRAANLHGATFTSITISGNGHVVSGVLVDRNALESSGIPVLISGSNIRFTRSIAREGQGAVSIGIGSNPNPVHDVLVDHCELSHYNWRCVNLGGDKAAIRRPILARCWFHTGVDNGFGPDGSLFSTIAFGSENLYREQPVAGIVRFCYFGPGLQDGDHVHTKTSDCIFAFNRADTTPDGSNKNFGNRFGLRCRYIANYLPNQRIPANDSLCWYFGNLCTQIQCWAGRAAYYDDTKNNSDIVGGFHANNRTRIAGNQTTVRIGVNNPAWLTNTFQPGLPDPMQAGEVKPARSHDGVNYPADDPDDPDVGIRVYDNSPTEIDFSNDTDGFRWYTNVQNNSGQLAPSSWADDLPSWITDIVDPTKRSNSPWSIAEGLTRGDAQNPNTGPFRDGPGGLL
jgi:hypothetical protein